jgi:peptidoglycan-N-acetylglucosamine deacetylase
MARQLERCLPSAISRGEFGAVATERLLQMLARWEIRSTWFIPGHTIDTYPDLVRRIADAGHEIGHHNYCHENPISLSLELEEETRVLDRGTDAIRRITGKPPEGFRSPAWDLNRVFLTARTAFRPVVQRIRRCEPCNTRRW